jgi:hypothetical protein
VIVKFGDYGIPVWDRRISIANATSKILFDPDSITIIECRESGYAVVSPILNHQDGKKTWGIYLCHLDDFGNVVWNRVFNEIDIDLDLSMVEMTTGGFAISGTYRFIHENAWTRGVFVIRTDEIGEPLWTRTHPELVGVTGHSLVSCINGDLAIAGTSKIHSDLNSNMILTRIGGDGSLLWMSTLGSAMNDEANSLLESSDGDFIVVGSTQSEDGGDDLLVVRTTAEGTSVWNCTCEDEGPTIGMSVCSMGTDGFAITGFREPPLIDLPTTLLVLIDTNGDILNRWSLRYDSRLIPYRCYDACCGYSIVQSNDGGFLIAGIVRQNAIRDDWDMMLLETDTQGNILWNATYETHSWSSACSLSVCEDRGFVLAGYRVYPIG